MQGHPRKSFRVDCRNVLRHWGRRLPMWKSFAHDSSIMRRARRRAVISAVAADFFLSNMRPLTASVHCAASSLQRHSKSGQNAQKRSAYHAAGRKTQRQHPSGVLRQERGSEGDLEPVRRLDRGLRGDRREEEEFASFCRELSTLARI